MQKLLFGIWEITLWLNWWKWFKTQFLFQLLSFHNCQNKKSLKILSIWCFLTWQKTFINLYFFLFLRLKEICLSNSKILIKQSKSSKDLKIYVENGKLKMIKRVTFLKELECYMNIWCHFTLKLVIYMRNAKCLKQPQITLKNN